MSEPDRVSELTAMDTDDMLAEGKKMAERDKKLERCRGCRNDYYNHGDNSTTGECWMLERAEAVKRVCVGSFQNPPYRWLPVLTNHCWEATGRHMLKRDDCRVVDDSDEAVLAWNKKS